MAELQLLKNQRTVIKSQATKFKTFVEKYVPNKHTRFDLDVRYDKFKELWVNYDTVQTNIDKLLEAPDTVEREGFEDAYYTLEAKVRAIFELLNPPPANIQVTQQTSTANSGGHSQPNPSTSTNGFSTEHAHHTNAKLPILKLLEYNGSYEQFQYFYDTFEALVDKNDTIQAVTKLHYLQTALTGKAKEFIQQFEMTADSYADILKTFKERFQNKRLIIQHYVKELFNLAPVYKESASELRVLLDNAQKHLRVLKQFDQPVDHWDTLVIHLITAKVDKATNRQWEEKVITHKWNTTAQLTAFLSTRCQVLEATQNSKSIDNQSEKINKFVKKSNEKSAVHVIANDRAKEAVCAMCRGNHRIYAYKTFKDLTISARNDEIKKLRFCFNCLGPNHTISDCTAQSCKLCSRRHHTLLHPKYESTSRQTNSTHDTETAHDSNTNSTNAVVNYSATYDPTAILTTALIDVFDHKGRAQEARALLDNCSTSNFMTTELSKKLNLREIHAHNSIAGFHGRESQLSRKAITTIRSKHEPYEEQVLFTLTDTITAMLPIAPINPKNIRIPDSLDSSRLADPNYHVPQKIDVLLGSIIFWKSLRSGRIQLKVNQPIFQETIFGWLIGGPCTPKQGIPRSVCALLIAQDLDTQLEKFWDLEKCEERPLLSTEELKCENHFQKTHARNEDGRFILALPFRDDKLELGKSRYIAMRRLKSTEKKMAKDELLNDRYHEFIKEYEDLGHMSLVTDTSEENTFSNYLPHHGVTREESSTTKLRVVFDASCKTDSGKSLNDSLIVGPTIQQELFEIITRFRQHPYAMTADITKMYRQIQIREQDRKFQRILWRNVPDQPIKLYELNTVTYGTSSAPFQAIRCLHQLATENEESYPVGSNAIKTDFYVDDFISGAASMEELRQIKEDVSTVLSQGKFELRKWRSNVPNCFELQDDQSTMAFTEEGKTLGLFWNSTEDIFKYRVELSDKLATSKRHILSSISQIFDPLGLVGPITIKAKILMQRLWQLHIAWDDTLPADFQEAWKGYTDQLQGMVEIKIPRHVFCPSPERIELHGFSDASQEAYGACIYARSTNFSDEHTTHLLCAKSRVAPLKTISVPRLELNAAQLLAQLMNKVTRSLTIDIDDIYYWSDSTIVLDWIHGEAAQWKTFVGNRVSDIQERTHKNKWRHVRTETNPADIISRGINPAELPNAELWWKGPPWLQENSDIWDLPYLPSNTAPEARSPAVSFVISSADFNLLQRYSSLPKLRRVVAYCKRFAFNASCKDPTQRKTDAFTADELIEAHTTIIKIVQREFFDCEISELVNHQQVNSTSKLLALHPFLDNDGVLRVGGRLEAAPLSFNQKHPVILPAKHFITTLIIRHTHEDNHHAGTNALLAILRQEYWILSSHNVVRSKIRKCLTCFKKRPISPFQLMANLPENRVTPSRPFTVSGVDYAGPFTIKISRNRTDKAYLAVFICMATKAVHLEVVSSLSTDAFLNTLKRLIARRGKPACMCSDNGSNFLGAKNELNDLGRMLSDQNFQDSISNYTAERSIQWKFIPPYSPHQGGIWEAAVKSAKSHLKTVTTGLSFTFEELTTIFSQIEAILNSRPLTPLSSDPDDLYPLTPGHFLIGAPLTCLPEVNVLDAPTNRLSRYQLLMKCQQDFWRRWSREYLSNLQSRSKWKKIEENLDLKIGAMVLIKEENVPPMSWKLGRISELHRGRDGLVRTVSIKTPSGATKRALQKICLLPIET